MRLPSAAFEVQEGGLDPAVTLRIAHDSARALVHRVRASDDPDLVERMVAFTDEQGVLLSANPAFVELVQGGDAASLRGRSMADWLSPEGEGLNGLLAAVRQSGTLRLATRLRNERGHDVDVELSAVLIHNGDSNTIGLIIRAVQPRGPGVGVRGRMH